MARSGLAAVVVALILVGTLGSRFALDKTMEADESSFPLLQSLTVFPNWDSPERSENLDLTIAIAAKLVSLLFMLFFLAWAAGLASSKAAAFLAGWGSLVLASAVAGAVSYVMADLVVYDGSLSDREGGALGPLVRYVNSGANFGLYTGWLVAAAVTLARSTVLVSPREPFQVPVPPTSPTASWTPAAPASVPLTAAIVPPSPSWAPPQSPLPAVPVARRVEPPQPPAESTQVHPGVAAPSPDNDPTTTLD